MRMTDEQYGKHREEQIDKIISFYETLNLQQKREIMGCLLSYDDEYDCAELDPIKDDTWFSVEVKE